MSDEPDLQGFGLGFIFLTGATAWVVVFVMVLLSVGLLRLLGWLS